MGATRTVALTELPFRGISVNTTETAITVVASDSGVIFVNENASACTYTLPTVALAKGKWFWFFNVGAAGMVITGGTTDVMVGLNDAAADTVTFGTTSEKIGAACAIFCDGTNYFVLPFNAATPTYSG
jgi:hypothetical protein